jgi:hypothetical protein
MALRRRTFPAHGGVEPGFGHGLEARRPHFEEKIPHRFAAGAMSPGALGDLVEADYFGFDIITHGAARWKARIIIRRGEPRLKRALSNCYDGPAPAGRMGPTSSA